MEIWHDIQKKPSLLAHAPDPGLLPDPTSPKAVEHHVFGVLASRYDALVARSENAIVQHVCTEVENNLQQHLVTAVNS